MPPDRQEKGGAAAAAAVDRCCARACGRGNWAPGPLGAAKSVAWAPGPSLSIPSNPAHTRARATSVDGSGSSPSLLPVRGNIIPMFCLPPLNFACPNPPRAHTTKKSIFVVRPTILSPRPHKHPMWWPKKGKAFVRRRLLSRGKELPPECLVTGLVTGVLSRGAKAQNRGIANGVRSRKAF